MNFAMTRTSNWEEFYREPRMVECGDTVSVKITSEHPVREARYRVDPDD